MSYLHGHSLSDALNPQIPFRQPETLHYRFLQQDSTTAYFRAFAAESLRHGELLALAEQHLRQAAQAAGWAADSWQRVPVFIGSASYDLPEYESQYRDSALLPADYSLQQLADDLQQRSGNPHIFSLATACTSSAHALIQADNCLRSGGSEQAFVLGIESLNRMTLLHFHSLGLLADRHQAFGGKGLILGEGIAALALGRQAPNAAAMQLIAHAANTGSDLIQSDGQAQTDLIRRLLEKARIAPENILAVKTHGVGSSDGDAAEYAALTRIFPALPPLLAFKSHIGHTLGASGAIETARLHRCLQKGSSPDYRGKPQTLGAGYYLSNFFGFGGSNTAMIWQWTA